MNLDIIYLVIQNYFSIKFYGAKHYLHTLPNDVTCNKDVFWVNNLGSGTKKMSRPFGRGMPPSLINVHACS